MTPRGTVTPGPARYSAAHGERRKSADTSGSESAEQEPIMNLGGRLKRLREQKGLSVRGLARELGFSPSFVSQIENGKSQPSVATLYSLSQLLGVSIDELFASEDAAEVQPDQAVAAAGGVTALSVSGTDDSRVSRSRLGSPADAWPRDQVLARLSVTRPGFRHTLEMDSGVVWNRLADNTGPNFDFIEILYPPHSSSTTDRRLLQHVGSEFGYLVEGELEVTVGFEVFTLHVGESVGFDSAVPHLFANRTDKVARGIWCVRHGYV
jgi:transcriptional regulator with XRE-family HTH domain